MANFAIQSRRGNLVTSANPSDIHHQLITNHDIATITDKRNGNYTLVRSNVTINKKYAVASDCAECKKKRTASIRIAISAPQELSAEDRADFLNSVFEPAVAATRARLEAGILVGFSAPIEISVSGS